MRTFKILLTNILIILVIISLFKVNCFAFNEFMADKAKLNIYKFEESETEPVSDIKFLIYKVADDCISLETPSELETASGITDENGKVTFEIDNANFGRYLVVEENTSADVSSKIANFLVDIPMTNKEGTKWVYDISVYPKNQKIYGSVVLNKIDENNTLLPGAKFDLYKQDDTQAILTDFITNTNGQIVINNLPFGDYYFIETAAPEGFLLDNKTKHEFSIKASGEVTYDAQNSTKAISIDNENGVRVISVKNIKIKDSEIMPENPSNIDLPYFGGVGIIRIIVLGIILIIIGVIITKIGKKESQKDKNDNDVE